MTKYVCEVVIETDKKVTKKDLRKFIEEELQVTGGGLSSWDAHMFAVLFGSIKKVRVRSVDTD